MSDSPKPSALAGIPVPAAELAIPAGLFFEAADYTEANTRPEDLKETRRRVSGHRSRMKATVAQLMEDLVRINASLQAAVSHLASQIDKAERRYEAACLTDAQEPAA